MSSALAIPGNISPNAILARDKVLRDRLYATESTLNFSKFCGDNPWDEETGKPYYDKDTTFYPWMPYLESQAAYLDSVPSGIAKPIYPYFIGRDHFKTTAIACHMAKVGINQPEKLHGVIADTDDKANIRLMNISEIYKRDKVNHTFDNVLFSSTERVKDHYTSSGVRLKRKRDAGQPTFTAKGIMSKVAGAHFNGTCWFDDIVNEENYKNEELQYNLWLKLQQYIRYVCVPGCSIIISGTRYAMYDTYDYVLSDDSPLKGQLAPGYEVMGCFNTNDDGECYPLNPLRFCWEPEEKGKSVWYMGVEFFPVRASLVEEKSATVPKSEWYSQMENNPTSTENAIFVEEEFKQIIPVTSMGLEGWLDNADNVAQYIDPDGVDPSTLPSVGRLVKVLTGDLAYKAAKRNDFSVWFVVGVDGRNNLYLMDGARQKTDTTSIRQFIGDILRARDRYGIRTQLGVETHAKEAVITVAEMVAIGLNLREPDFHPLPDNSHKGKPVRIEALSPITSAGKVFVCEGFPESVMRALVTEAVTFPNGKYDDTIDALANYLQVVRPRKKKGKKRNAAAWRSRVAPGVRRFL